MHKYEADLGRIKDDISSTASLSIALNFFIEHQGDNQDMLNVSLEISKKLAGIVNKIARLEAKQEAEAH